MIQAEYQTLGQVCNKHDQKFYCDKKITINNKIASVKKKILNKNQGKQIVNLIPMCNCKLLPFIIVGRFHALCQKCQSSYFRHGGHLGKK